MIESLRENDPHALAILRLEIRDSSEKATEVQLVPAPAGTPAN
jgi:hypothetical protein